MKKIKTTFISTVFNEEKNITDLLVSIYSQSKLPDEIIIVDGGSTDKTISKMRGFKKHLNKRQEKVEFKIIVKNGNRSIGRNEAINKSKGEIIVCSDSGNILKNDWFKNIIKPFNNKSIDVVAGYYKSKAETIFQKCIVPYVFVMPDKVNKKSFLPATRSIAFTKLIWKKVGGFNESLSHNEDYAFAKQLKEKGAKIVFAQDAVVSWIPRNTFKEAFIMFFRFAYGDAEAGIVRKKVMLLFMRYIIGFVLLLASLLYKNTTCALFLSLLVVLYVLWSIKKNYKYINNRKALYLLPELQFLSDIAVLAGTSLGILKILVTYVKQNKLIVFICFIYITLVSLTLSIGTPNQNHPFLYHMDEWHQLMAIRAIVKEGTTTIPGAAHIPFVYPVLSGVYLSPFVLFQVINPFLLGSPYDHVQTQQRLFEILRSINILFGIGSVILIAFIAKRYLKINAIIPVYFFALSPILVLLSGYFKYDIGLLFFIVLSLTYILKFGDNPTFKNYIYASVVSGLALATKFSAAPLVPLLIFAHFWFNKKKERKSKHLFYGILIVIITFLLTGIPSLLIGKADFRELLYSNLISSPQITDVFNLSLPWWAYLTLKQFPYPFGHIAYLSGICAFLFIGIHLLRDSGWKIKENKNYVLLLVGFILFVLSLIPLKMGAGSNRVLVLLPFLSLFSGILFAQIYKTINSKYKTGFVIMVVIFMLSHIVETTVWMQTKLSRNPQEQSSEWIKANISNNSTIGVENIPIYQGLPDIILKEFYQREYMNVQLRYKYEVISSKNETLPKVIIITNDQIYKKIMKYSEKTELVKRLEKENYKKVASFTPDFTYYKFIGTDEDYFFSALLPSPLTISIYKK